MAFLNPLLLWGATAMSVPILIHILNKRKFKRIKWAAMRFVQLSIEQKQRRLQIEDLLLLALRCLLLLLLAMALARPTLGCASSSGLFGKASVMAVVVIDNSYSMSQTDGVASRLDRAKSVAEQAVESLPSGSSVAVMLVSNVVDRVIADPTHDLNLARKLIREAKLSHRGTDLGPAVTAAVELLRNRPALRKELFLITDGQASGWRQLREIQQNMAVNKKEIQSRVIFVGTPEERNLAVTDLRMVSGLAPVGRPLQFQVQVTNYGKVDANDVQVTLRTGDEPAPSDGAIIRSIKAGGSESAVLFARLRDPGSQTVTASVAQDHVPADDHRTLAVRALTEVKVLLVDGDPGGSARESEVFFLKNAIVPVPSAMLDAYFLKYTVVTTTDLETARLEDYHCVFLANVADMSPKVLEKLAAYLKRGNGLVIFPGSNTMPRFYNEQLGDTWKFLPATLGATRGDDKSETSVASFQDKNFEHEIAKVWNKPGSGTPASANFFKIFELKELPVAARKSGEAGPPAVVLRWGDKSPAVMERPWGAGKVVLFSSSADTSWNDLPVRPAIFVPLMDRLIGSIVMRQHDNLNVNVGQPFLMREGPEYLSRDALITPPGTEASAAKPSRRFELQSDKGDGRPTMKFEETGLGGTYVVSLPDTKRTERFAVQLVTDESDLEALGGAQIKQISEAAEVVNWPLPPAVSFVETLQKSRIGTELWLPFAIAALLVAISESFLAQWFSRSK